MGCSNDPLKLAEPNHDCKQICMTNRAVKCHPSVPPLRFADRLLTKAHFSLVGERSALLIFLFHVVFEDAEEIEQNIVPPVLGMLRDEIRDFLSYYQQHGYRFVSPDEVLSGLPPGKFCLITFDDGYFNNLRVVPVLEELNAPGLFFISTNHVLENRAFWWDSIYRHRMNESTAPNVIESELASMKSKTHIDIESYVREQFGPSSLRPVGDLDRPMTASELKEFAAHELVHIGNHTSDHALLTNYDAAGVKDQIATAQDQLKSMLGEAPKIISYPNGNHSDEICRIASEVGLECGITVRPNKNLLPMNNAPLANMKLGRFMPSGNEDIEEQAFNIRSDVRLARRLKAWGARGKGNA